MKLRSNEITKQKKTECLGKSNTLRHSTAGVRCTTYGAIDAPAAVSDADRHYFNCTLTRPWRVRTCSTVAPRRYGAALTSSHRYPAGDQIAVISAMTRTSEGKTRTTRRILYYLDLDPLFFSSGVFDQHYFNVASSPSASKL